MSPTTPDIRSMSINSPSRLSCIVSPIRRLTPQVLSISPTIQMKKRQNQSGGSNNGRKKAALVNQSLRRKTKDNDIVQGPKIWNDIYSPAKFVLFYTRDTEMLSVVQADDVACQNFEIRADHLCEKFDFSQFFGPGSSDSTIRQFFDSIAAGESTNFYFNLYTLSNRCALSSHISTTILGVEDMSHFVSAPIIVIILTARSASSVGNAKLIAYGLHSESLQTVETSPMLKDNIQNAFGML